MAPKIGQIVHYVSYGTPGGEYSPECRAAIITEVSELNEDWVGLVVFNPDGLFFHSLAKNGCPNHELPPGSAGMIAQPVPSNYLGDSWHWVEHINSQEWEDANGTEVSPQ